MRATAIEPPKPTKPLLYTGETPPANFPRAWSKPALALTTILLIFLALSLSLPLGTTVQIGADEGFNLAKATLLLKGYKLYSDVWSDQPPLHTFLLTQALKHISPSVDVARLVTVGFSVVLLISLYLMSLRFGGILVATLATLFVVASPGFVELASSCMLEIPALATGLLALAVLSLPRPSRFHAREILSGAIFAAALQIKFSPTILLPVAFLIILLDTQLPSSPPEERARERRSLLGCATRRFLILLAAVCIGWPCIDLLLDHGAYLSHFHQSWISHFAGPKSAEYGSPSDHRFDWTILLKNWDTTLPAIAGISFSLRNLLKSRTGSTIERFNSSTLVPIWWLAASLGYFALHHPWWTYYYIHIALPLCWCAALGVQSLIHAFRNSKFKVQGSGLNVAFATLRRFTVPTLFTLFLLSAAAWQTGRIYLQFQTIRNSPQTYYDLGLPELQRYKPFTHWIYSDEPIYSFHSGIPVPPQLAVLSLKRLWSGEMTNARIAAEVQNFKPGLILLRNDTRALPFQDFMNTEYRLVYQDDRHRLYAHREISEKPF